MFSFSPLLRQEATISCLPLLPLCRIASAGIICYQEKPPRVFSRRGKFQLQESSMIAKNWLRYLLGVILGGAAGLSLTATVLPMLLSLAGLGEEFLIRWDLGGYAAHCVLVFAFGGWLIAKLARKPWHGTLVLGGIGLICGILLAVVVYAGEGNWLLMMSVAAAAYGAVGGGLLGHVLKKPDETA
jgi:hypothetical protein